jgi:hypothetical protein
MSLPLKLSAQRAFFLNYQLRNRSSVWQSGKREFNMWRLHRPLCITESRRNIGYVIHWRRYPNVGKSSLINSLKRSKVVGVGATPGFTRAVQVPRCYLRPAAASVASLPLAGNPPGQER